MSSGREIGLPPVKCLRRCGSCSISLSAIAEHITMAVRPLFQIRRIFHFRAAKNQFPILLVILKFVWYDNQATQVQISHVKACVFTLVKMQALLSYAFGVGMNLCGNKWGYAFFSV